jgi:hypothetical protein
MPKATPQAVDLSDFYRLSRPKKPPCKIGHALDQLTPANRKKLEAALLVDKGIITGQAIADWIDLLELGVEMNQSAVQSHRSKRCSCAKP